MTGWVGLIAVALAYLSVGAVLAAEKLRAALDDACACGCDVYDQAVDYIPAEFACDLTDEEAEACCIYMEAEAIWAATVTQDQR